MENSINNFVNLNNNGIITRIYFIIGDKIDSFIEYQFGDFIVQNINKKNISKSVKKNISKSVKNNISCKSSIDSLNKYNGNIFSIDQHGNISDQTFVFSKKQKFYRFYKRVLNLCIAKLNSIDDIKLICTDNGSSNSIGNNIKSLDNNIESLDNNIKIFKNNIKSLSNSINNYSDCESSYLLDSKKSPIKKYKKDNYLFENFSLANNQFHNIDNTRFSEIPKTYNLLKIHPLFTTEKLCKKNEMIFPKRPICGIVNNENVYYRELVHRLRTEKGWYMHGRVLKREVIGNIYKPVKPYRITDKIKLYAEFQTENIKIEKITGRIMDAFHENFIPSNSAYVDFVGCENICEFLNIEYSQCAVGFRTIKKSNKIINYEFNKEKINSERIIKGCYVYKKDLINLHAFAIDSIYYECIRNLNQYYNEIMREWRILIRITTKYIKIREHIGI